MGHFRLTLPIWLDGYVRFAPKATEIRRCREMTRCAMTDLRTAAKRPLFEHLVGKS
jgi:hypothetical protein